MLMDEILSISLKLNFSPNTLGCYGLKYSLTSLVRKEGNWFSGASSKKVTGIT